MKIERYGMGLAALMLVGCGGGGGGGDDNSNPPPPPPPADTLTAITPDNGQAVAGAAVAATQFAQELGLTSLGGSLLFVPQSAVTPPADADDAMRMAVLTLAQPQDTIEDTFLCSLGGQILITAEVAAEGTFTAGDAVTAFFDNCEEASATTDGAVDALVNGLTGDIAAPPFQLDLNVALTELTITTGETSAISEGAIAATLSSETPDDLTILLAGDSLATTVDGVATTVSDFAITLTDNVVTGDYTVDANGTLNDDDLGAFEFSHATPFAGVGSEFPSAGALVVTGEDDTTATLTALDNTNVRIELDTDGDGAVDETLDTTWAELAAQ
jgi:hypothetical protein